MQTAWKEHLLIEYGSAIEDLTAGRKRPEFRNLHAKNYMFEGVPPEQSRRDRESLPTVISS